LNCPYKRIDVLKAFSTTKVTEEERAKNTSITECFAATSTFVSQALGVLTRIYAAELRKSIIL
jgi:hypothetical protein